MEKNDSPEESLKNDQLEKYAADLTEVYRAEKEKRKALEAANKKLQETMDMLVQSEKLAAIGRLTTGVAHEIINPVNIISMYLQFLETTEELTEEGRKTLFICREQLDRITKISEDLGAFSRLHKHEITMNDLNKVIEHNLSLIAPQFKQEGVKTEVSYYPDLPLIPLYKDRFEQVIFNLFSNAIAAMAGQETKILRIMTKPAVTKKYIQIVISDTGTGIDQDHVKNIFEPFFTTKDPGKGTGLGLFISYKIITEHGGKIRVENNESGGASFYIEIPVEGLSTDNNASKKETK